MSDSVPVVHIYVVSDAMAKIGYMLLHWGYLEKAIDEQVEKLVQQGNGLQLTSLTDRVSRWLATASAEYPMYENHANELAAEINNVRKQRNILAHGMVDVTNTEDMVAVVCRSSAASPGELRSFTINQLVELVDAIDRCSIRVRNYPYYESPHVG